MSNDTLFSQFKLKNFTLRNRIGVAPMTRMSSQQDSVPRQDVFDFLVRRAQNGAAIVYTEAMVTDYESSQGYPGQARIVTQRQIDAWKPIVDAIDHEGSMAIMQMFHCGRMAWPEVNPAGRVIGPSPITPKQLNPLTKEPYPIPDEMTKFDIEHVIAGFIETAKGAVDAGFHGVEIHGAHGYLISQFLSSHSNKRTDDYGGSNENRYRLAHQIIQAVSNVIPDDRILTFRISNWGVADMDVSLFKNREEWQDIIKRLSKEPIDAISLSTYDYTLPAFETDRNMSQMTREVSDKPIMICGKIYDRITADKALNDADIILSAKSILLNPDWVEDIKASKPLEAYKSDDANIAYTNTPLP